MRRVPAAAAVVLAAAAALASLTGARTLRPAPLTRYSLAHGCFTASGVGAGPLRMQPAWLAQYLLYTRAGRFVGADLTPVSAPSQATVWRVDGSAARGFTLVNTATSRRMAVTFHAASGCAAYPEASVDATGPGYRGASPEAGVLGTVEGHAHVMGYELFGGDWHCGSPWSPFGAPYALPGDCSSKEQGTNGEVEAFLDFGGANRPSDFHGWPTFKEWPSPTTLAEEGDYYTAIERAWRAGLRILVSNNVDNEALCGLMTTRHNPCNDMSSAAIQAHDLYSMQNYIDAQSGGPGRGWFRIVTDPFQARRVINQGKLAVVMGIEVSRLFGCGEYQGTPQCTTADIDAGLGQVIKLGVRTFFPVHEFDNAFGGTKGISGETGAVVNAGNREETGSFMTMQPCPARDQDAEQVTPGSEGDALATVLNGPGASLLGGNPLPVYGTGPQCNTRGLTSLGAYLIDKMIKDHLVIQLDHMDSKTATAALAIATAHHYAGVTSAHCCSSGQLFRQVYADGGFITEPQTVAPAFVNVYRADRALRDPHYLFGFGYGSDMNGLAQQAGPSSPQISYPFRSYLGGVTFTREVWGQRTFDLNTEGLANYGLYADWLHQLQLAGGSALMHDMFNGAEAYLEMWERAYGVGDPVCVPRSAAQRVNARMDFRAVLYALGQPRNRAGRAYAYRACGGGTLTITFSARTGRVASHRVV